MGSETAPLAVTVVGAGLSGSLIALYLARRGHQVEVYERRADPRVGHGESGRSINLGLSARGIHALGKAGLLDELMPTAVTMRGRMVHNHDGTLGFFPYGTAEHEVLHSVLRHDLNVLLVIAADALPNVRFHFDAPLTALDKDTGVTWLSNDGNAAERSAKADLVIGADGAFSVVRDHLVRGERANYQQEFLDWGYKELTISPGPDGRPRTELEALHVWPSEHGLMVAHPNRDGSLTCTLFLPFEGPNSFASLSSPTAVRQFFDTHFPDVPRLMPNLLEEYAVHPVGNMVTVQTSAWCYRDKVVLVGDAAHAVYPFYGQGMNAAFEDCVVLDSCLQTGSTDRSAALADYQRRRKRNTDVLAELAKQNFEELRDRLRSPRFALRKHADLLLNRLFPRSWRPLYTMVSHTTMPYADALERARRQDAVAAWVGGSLAGTAVLAAGVAAGRMVARRGSRC